MELRPDLARKTFEDGPCRSLGMSVEEASMGAVQILTHSMVQSIEENSVRKGYDPRTSRSSPRAGPARSSLPRSRSRWGRRTCSYPPTRA